MGDLTRYSQDAKWYSGKQKFQLTFIDCDFATTLIKSWKISQQTVSIKNASSHNDGAS